MPVVVPIDPTEYTFKLALVKRQYDVVFQMIRTSHLVGQAIISHLQMKGYPDIALNFVQDPIAKFNLALECGQLEIALEMAHQLASVG